MTVKQTAIAVALAAALYAGQHAAADGPTAPRLASPTCQLAVDVPYVPHRTKQMTIAGQQAATACAAAYPASAAELAAVGYRLAEDGTYVLRGK